MKKILILTLLSCCSFSCRQNKFHGAYVNFSNYSGAYSSGLIEFDSGKKYYIVLTGNLTKDCILDEKITIDVIGSEKNSFNVSKEKFFKCNWGPTKARFNNNLHENLAVEIPIEEIQKSLDSDFKNAKFLVVINGRFLDEKIHSFDLLIHN